MLYIFISVSFKSSDPEHFLVTFGAIILIGALFALVGFYFSRKHIVRKGLRKAPLYSISEFHSGSYGKIIGRAFFAGEILVAPLSGRKCVYYFFKIEAQRNRGKETLVYEESMGDLVLTDGKNYALIKSTKPKAFIVPDRNFSSGPFDKPTARMLHVIKKYKIDPENLIGLNRDLDYEEGILAENEECIVSGIGKWELSADHNINVPAKKILVMRIHPDEGLLLTDDPGTIKEGKEV